MFRTSLPSVSLPKKRRVTRDVTTVRPHQPHGRHHRSGLSYRLPVPIKRHRYPHGIRSSAQRTTHAVHDRRHQRSPDQAAATAGYAENAVTHIDRNADQLAEILMPGSQVKQIDGPVLTMPNGKMYEVVVRKKDKSHRHKAGHPAADPSHGSGRPGKHIKRAILTASIQTTTRKSDKSECVTKQEEFKFLFDEDVVTKDPFDDAFASARSQKRQKDDPVASPVIDDRYLGDDNNQLAVADPGSPFGENTSDQQELDEMFNSLLGMRSLYTEVPKTSLNETYDLLHEAAAINGVDMSETGIKNMMKKRKAAELAGRPYSETSAGGKGLDNRRGHSFMQRLDDRLQATTDIAFMDRPLFF